MDQLESLSHSVWECKYHVAFIPKCRRRVLYEGLRPHLGEVLRRLARTYGEHKQNFAGQHFWARGYFVSTVGRDETAIREYIRNQEVEDKRLDQLWMWK